MQVKISLNQITPYQRNTSLSIEIEGSLTNPKFQEIILEEIAAAHQFLDSLQGVEGEVTVKDLAIDRELNPNSYVV